MKETNEEYWKIIEKIVELQNEILDEENEPRRNEEYINASYGLIHDLYLLLFDKGYTKEQIDRDVAYT